MFGWLSLIPGSGLLSAAAGIVTAGINLIAPLVPRVWDAVAWYLRSFVNGLTVIFHNLSTMTVIITLILASGWAGKHLDDKYFDKPCVVQKHPTKDTPVRRPSNSPFRGQ